MYQTKFEFGIKNDIEECKSFAERARALAKEAEERLDNEDAEYWTNSIDGWLTMIAELEAELKESDRG